MAELIQKTDTLNEGREKLNEAIKDAGKAKIDSSEAKATAEQALDNSESTQTQLDQVVIDGDSSVEAAQARVDEKGQSHTTLKDRIDDGFTKVNSQLADKAEQSDLDNTNAALSKKADESWVEDKLDEKRDKNYKIKLEDMEEEVLGAMSGNSEFSLKTIPQEDSVGLEELKDVVKREFVNREHSSYSSYVRNSDIEIEYDGSGVFIKIGSEGFRLATIGSQTLYSFDDVLTDINKVTEKSPSGKDGFLKMLDQEILVYNSRYDRFELISMTMFDGSRHVILLRIYNRFPYSGFFYEDWMNKRILKEDEQYFYSDKDSRVYFENDGRDLYIKLKGHVDIFFEGQSRRITEDIVKEHTGLEGALSPSGEANFLMLEH